jgi:hypothetical protein
MPRSLRWLSAVSTAIIAQLLFQFLLIAILIGTGHKRVSGGIGALVGYGAALVGVLSALAMNDWLAGKYPVDVREPAKL